MEQIERIKIPVDDLERISTDMKDASQEFLHDTERISGLLSDITNAWQGEEMNHLVFTTEESIQDCQNLIETLKNITQRIDETCKVYRKANAAFINQ